MSYWDKKENLSKYVGGIRQFFPLAEEQLDMISRIIEKFNPSINAFLDLGCGDGFLGYFIYEIYPDAHGVFLDRSPEMIAKAVSKDADHNSKFVVQDFADPDWYRSISTSKKFDLIVAGYSIHHIENNQKQRLYRDIFELLNANGIFLNLEHVSSSTPVVQEMFNELFLDGMFNYHEHIKDKKTREEIEQIYNGPEHKILNKLESVEKQCKWLKNIGFTNVDCYMKIFELALFGGIKQ
jgi:SAM-dependent methyltransferase